MRPKDYNLSDTSQFFFENTEANTLEAIDNKRIIRSSKDSNVAEHEGSPIIKASEVEMSQAQQLGITTSSKRFDQLFGPIHGIPRRSLIEFSGASGCGKTHLCITLALNVQLPIEKGGLDGQCIYIDTEGGLMVDRFYQMTGKDNDDEHIRRRKLENIIHYRVLDFTEMVALMHQLPDILQNSPKVKLLIVDSVAYHFRFNIANNRTRVGLIDKTGRILAEMATQFNLAVVVTSHVSPNLRTGKLRPALGESWAQWCTKRLMLTRKRHQRFASIYDPSQETPFMMEPFIITEKGIEDVDEETLARTNQWQVSETKQDNDTSQHKAQQQDSDSLPCTSIYDSEDIWNEHGGFTDELLSEIPSVISSLGSSINDEDEEDDRLMPDLQLDIQQSEGEDDGHSNAITTSVIPPTSTPYLSQTLRRKQLSQSQDSDIIILNNNYNNNKKARHDKENTSTSSPPSPSVDDVKNDQNDDEWGPESDELWLAVAELSPPSV